MRNLRRLMVVVLAIAMVATSMATAFGAPFSDISGKKYEAAVNKLQAFGIAAGVDGQYKGEDKLTRAEFATFITKMMGLGALDKVDTIFSDATAKDWFSGYVNAVAEAGYMVGAEGKFNPEKNVTYGEAITVLMKMIGYAPVVDNRGTWPSNYINRANSIKLTDGVTVSASAYVTRGYLAMLIWNALVEPKLVEGDTYDEDGNPTYKVAEDNGENTLLYANFNEAKQVKKATVTEIPMTSAGYDNNKIKISKDGETDSFKVPAGTDANALLGLEVTYVADADNNIKCIDVTTAKEDMIYDTVKTYIWEKDAAGAFINTDINTITFTKIDKAFKAADNMKLFYNGVLITPANYATIMAEVADFEKVAYGVQDVANIYAVLNKDTNYIDYAFITQDVPELTFSTDLVNTQYGLVTTAGDKIKSETFGDIDRKAFNDKAELGISKNIVYKDGKVAKLNDVKKGDIIRVTRLAGGLGIIIWAYTPDIKTVKIDSIEDLTSLKNVKLVAGDVKYQFNESLLYSKNNGTDKEKFTTSKLAELSQYVGVEGTKLYVGPSGKVAYFENAVDDSDTLYGVVIKHSDDNVTNAAGKTTNKLTIAKPDGSTASYVTKNALDNGDSLLNKLISYKLSTSNEMVSPATVDNAITLAEDVAINVDNGVITTSGGTSIVTSATVFMNLAKVATSSVTGEVDIVDWDTVKEQIDEGTLARLSNVRVAFEDGAAQVVYLYEDSFTSATKYGVIVGSGLRDGVQTLKVNYEGTVTEYDVAKSVYLTAYGVKGLLVDYTITDDEISINKVGDSVVSTGTYAYNPLTGALRYKKLNSEMANGAFTDAIVSGKVVNVDKANGIITFNKVINLAGDVENNNTEKIEWVTYIEDDVQIFNIRDVNAITYSDDLSTVTGLFVYDRAANTIIMVKGSTNENVAQLNN